MVQRKGYYLSNGSTYHLATNGAAEYLVHIFKQSYEEIKSSTQEFLLQYQCTPLDSGYTPS